MARMPGAVWIGPTLNMHPGGMQEIRGLALHIQDGNEQGSEAWFKERVSKASAHFLNPRTGSLKQLVDTADMAWAQADGNPFWISIENEGWSGDLLTDSQMENAAQLFAWLHTHDGVPLQITDSTTGRGLGWHGMGGNAWGGHPDCPGKPVLAQRPALLLRAQHIIGTPPLYVPFPGREWFTVGRKDPIVLQMRNRLIERGCNRYRSALDPDVIGSGDIASYRAWQRKCGFSGKDATWPPGQVTWDKLQVPFP